MKLPNETFEQMQMRLSLETIRELEVQNEELKKEIQAWAVVDRGEHPFQHRPAAELENEVRVLQNDITQLEAQLESERRSNKERAAWISQLQDQVAALQQAPARIQAANPGAKVGAPRSAREAVDRIDPYDSPRRCGAGALCDDVTCRGHW